MIEETIDDVEAAGTEPAAKAETHKHTLHMRIVQLGHAAEHPFSIAYAFFDAMEAHGALFYISIGLVVSGLFAVVYVYINGGE